MQILYSYRNDDTGGQALLNQACVTLLQEAFGPLRVEEHDGITFAWADDVTMEAVDEARWMKKLVKTFGLEIFADSEEQYEDWKHPFEGFAFVSPSGKSLDWERRQDPYVKQDPYVWP